jgi:hypothetical protein
VLRALRAAFACALITLAVTGTARAAGGNYTFDGGTAIEQQQVTSALNASAFPWGVVPGLVTIHVAPGLATRSVPGQIWLDASLVDTGTFSWGLIQHEYGHQVDFLMLSDGSRKALTSVLGGKVWCWGEGASLDHAAYGCERFASTLAWSFWQSPDNVLGPQGGGGESAGLPPAQFRALLGALLKAQTDEAQLVTIQQFVGRAPQVSAARPVTAAPAAGTAARRESTRRNSGASLLQPG